MSLVAATPRRNSARLSWGFIHPESLAGYALAAPGFLLLVMLFFLPVLAVFVIAATDWQFGAKTLSFVGLKNFVVLFSDPTFRTSFLNTIVYVGLVVPSTVTAGLLLALVIERSHSLRTFYRAVHFLPYMATLTAMAIAWEALLDPTIGLANQILAGAGYPAVNWLRNENTVLPVLAVIGVWQNLGFAMVLYMAGLKAIPQDLYDAADVDGADSFLDRFTTVTLPMLGPVTMFVVIVTALRAFQVFDTVKVLTQGGPGDVSEVLLYTLYVESFEFLRTGYGAAMTLVFLAIIVTLTLLQAAIVDRRVHYS